ncbi:hypothetical protein KQH62_00905 [bacterium]|nr:hypothetical protein [bacterium]
MEEIRKQVFIEDGYPGVVLGAVCSKRGIFIVDAPFRTVDQDHWRRALSRLDGDIGKDKMLLMLDTHIDRTLGVRAMESVLVGQENSVTIMENRPTAARSQEIDAGADWEPFDLPPNIRWVLPELTFSQSLSIYWGEIPLLLEHHPGAHIAGSWLKLENEKVVFVGDSVVIHQPPFLAFADLDAWVADFDLLLSDEYKGYKIISGRNGIVRPRSIEKAKDTLLSIKQAVEDVGARGAKIEDLLAEVPSLLKPLRFNSNLTQLYHNRLSWGLEHYYKQHYLHTDDE